MTEYKGACVLLPLLYPELNFMGFSFSLHVHQETSKAPIVHIYPAIPGNSRILTCFIRNFFPRQTDVQWLKNGQAIPEKDYVNTPAVKENSGDSYFQYSKLSIPELSWDQGNEFSCEVVHEALETKVTQKSIKKTLGKR